MNKLQVSVLASGSTPGNAVAIIPGDGPAFLLDCGLSMAAIKSKMTKLIGKEPSCIKAAYITHLHGDHLRASSYPWEIIVNHKHGVPYQQDSCKITPFALAHDIPCHGFRVEKNGLNIGYVTDTVLIPEQSLPYLFDLDLLIIEANYRPELTYDVEQVYGAPDCRHLSNKQAACIIGLVNSNRLKYVVMSHLSSRHNSPAFACNAGKQGAPQAEIIISGDVPTKLITLMN